ncbi:alpha-mannosidase, partial [bacterium]|nr:alpha-mannosidase [bacterium]
PAQKWIDVADSEKGISLLNDSKYGHDVRKNVMRLSLLRSSYSPDHEPDLGIHRFSYSLVPHAGNWQDAHTAQKALDFNLPLRAVTSIPRDGNWPCQKSFLKIAAENIIVSALKKAEDSSDLILRCYEVYGKPAATSCECGFDIIGATETDMIERDIDASSIPVSGNRFPLSFTPFEIKTIRLKRPKFTWPIHHGFIPV